MALPFLLLVVHLLQFWPSRCLAQTTLRAGGDLQGIWMGAAGNYYHIKGDDKTYPQVLGEQYSLITAENGCKWSATEPEEDVYDYTQCDTVYNFGVESNMTFRGHNLCWGNYNPSWLENGDFDESQLRVILKNHIGNVTQHYGNKAYAWDVVNEAVSDNPSEGNIYKDNVWYPTVPDYVQAAFQYARESVPGVKLFYNDYNIIMASSWMQKKSDTVFDLASDLHAQGLLDGIGMQAHLNMGQYPLDVDAITRNFQRYNDLGIEIHITELDIQCQNGNGKPCTQQDYDTTLEAQQGEMYSQLLEICLQFPMCTNFETWGFTDKYTWVGSDERPLPFDIDYQPKDAVTDLLQTLTSGTKRKNAQLS